MKKILSLVLVMLPAITMLFAGAGNHTAVAQAEDSGISYKNVKLWVYPEYDDPRLLVMLQGQIVGAEPPVEVRFLVPSAAEMYSAGSMDAQGQYSGGPPQREQSSIPGWDEVYYEVKSDTFRVEYYDPVIIGRPDKTISYDFRSLYPIADLSVIVQEPRRSSNFSVSPAGRAFTDNEGFTAYQYSFTNLDIESPLHFDIYYTKSDTSPSLQINDTGGGSNSPLIAIVIVVLVSAAAFGGYLLLRKHQPQTRAARRRVSRTAGVNPGSTKKGGRYCRQCGQPLGESDQYCPNCGAKK